MSKELQFLIYKTPEENVSVNAVTKNETIWLTQKAMAELFDCTTDNVSFHLKNIYADGELKESSTTEEFSVVQQESTRKVNRKTKDILRDKGGISKKQAYAKAQKEYIHFNKTQKIISDFDREAKKLIAKGGDDDA